MHQLPPQPFVPTGSSPGQLFQLAKRCKHAVETTSMDGMIPLRNSSTNGPQQDPGTIQKARCKHDG